MSSAGPVFNTTTHEGGHAQINNVTGNFYVLSEDKGNSGLYGIISCVSNRSCVMLYCRAEDIQMARCSGQLRQFSGSAGEALRANRNLVYRGRRVPYMEEDASLGTMGLWNS
ncbi:hypothetical protein FIBSPDRAFT_139166 [Athelia psychrophila]|uniref:Uncharacterized protein n=1 Tax=Athelia psychrophila TaxID=1759441 RepID=A0A166C001_9AGAM|nr:hypothetical protein FIBSPDRAFT_139166 [Fibularhizoctonia sp. CBS 109695]